MPDYDFSFTGLDVSASAEMYLRPAETEARLKFHRFLPLSIYTQNGLNALFGL